MDHLPPIDSAACEPLLKVPCVASQDYDTGEFHSYPNRRNFSPDITEQDDQYWIDPSGYTLESRTALFQEWLFFGTLGEVFSAMTVTVNPRDFIEGDYITMRKFEDYIRRASLAFLRLPTEGQALAMERIELCLTISLHYSSFRPPGTMDVVFTACSTRWPIALSITSLTETLLTMSLPWTDSFLSSISARRLSLITGLLTRQSSGVMENVLVEKMVRIGWCPNQIAAFPTMDATTAYHLARLSPAKLRDHSHCSPCICLCDQIVELGDYKPQHVHGCEENCGFLGASTQKLNEIIKSGGLPLLRVEGESKENAVLRVMRWDAAESYIALSHVWSHGLGNKEDNALPTCQMLRIMALIRKLSPQSVDFAFWIDTVCLPISGPCRTLGIRSMTSVYKAASLVLVLDEDLQQIGPVNEVERAIRLSSSTWQRRLWTLQEGCLTPDYAVVFQFKDCALTLQEIQHNCLGSQPACFVSTVPGKVVEPLLPLSFMDYFKSIADNTSGPLSAFQGESPLGTTILFLLETLAWRNTSRASDEPVCIASIMGFDPAFLLEHEEADDRMEVFLRRLARLPQDMLFQQGRKLTQKPGMGWAPSSFLGKKAFAFLRYRWATLTSAGLPVFAAGTVLMSPSRDEILQLKSSQTPDVANKVVLQRGGGHWTLYDCDDCTTEDTMPVDFSKLDRPALIFREEIDLTKDQNYIACLVNLVKPKSPQSAPGPILTHFRALVSIRGGRSTRIREDDVRFSSSFVGVYITEQEWIVG